MKKAVILHGTNASHTDNWLPWLKTELEKSGYEVWVPDLPHPEQPNMGRYTEYLLSQDWDFNDNLIVGHSSGAVAVLGLLEALPANVKIGTAVLVGSFTERLAEDPSWGMLRELFGKPFDFASIRRKAGQFIFVHSDDDPYCPVDQAKELHEHLGGEFVLMHGCGHFSAKLDPRFTQFPELLDVIKREVRP